MRKRWELAATLPRRRRRPVARPVRDELAPLVRSCSGSALVAEAGAPSLLAPPGVHTERGVGCSRRLVVFTSINASRARFDADGACAPRRGARQAGPMKARVLKAVHKYKGKMYSKLKVDDFTFSSRLRRRRSGSAGTCTTCCSRLSVTVTVQACCATGCFVVTRQATAHKLR